MPPRLICTTLAWATRAGVIPTDARRPSPGYAGVNNVPQAHNFPLTPPFAHPVSDITSAWPWDHKDRRGSSKIPPDLLCAPLLSPCVRTVRGRLRRIARALALPLVLDFARARARARGRGRPDGQGLLGGKCLLHGPTVPRRFSRLEWCTTGKTSPPRGWSPPSPLRSRGGNLVAKAHEGSVFKASKNTNRESGKALGIGSISNREGDGEGDEEPSCWRKRDGAERSKRRRVVHAPTGVDNKQECVLLYFVGRVQRRQI